MNKDFNKIIWIAETSHLLHKVYKIDINRSYRLGEDFFDSTINEVERGLTYQEKYHMDSGWVYINLKNIPNGRNGTKKTYVNGKSISIKTAIQKLNPLFEVITTGNNINKSKSLINASHLIGYVIERDLPHSESLPIIIDMVYGEDAKNLDKTDMYDVVRIDLFSLKNYISRTKEYYSTLDYHHGNRNKTISCIDKANKIYAIASGFLGFMPHFESLDNTSSRTLNTRVFCSFEPIVIRIAFTPYPVKSLTITPFSNKACATSAEINLSSNFIVIKFVYESM